MKKKILVIMLIILILGTGGVAFLLTRHENSKKTVDAEVFQATVTSIETDANDGPGIYTLDNGRFVEYSCGFCAYGFSGKIIGSPQIGDKVEVRANHVFTPDTRPTKDYYFIYEPGLYIKKL